jgi:hypothetical protein
MGVEQKCRRKKEGVRFERELINGEASTIQVQAKVRLRLQKLIRSISDRPWTEPQSIKMHAEKRLQFVHIVQNARVRLLPNRTAFVRQATIR